MAALKVIRPASKEEYFEALEQDEYVIGSLLRLYSFQTNMEQNAGGTIEDNGMGFNGVDGEILSSMSKFYNSRKYLTVKQLAYARKAVKKYVKQLVGGNILPMPLQVADVRQKETVKKGKFAKLTDGSINITFPFDRMVLDQIKSLSGRKWNPDGKFWTAPVLVENIQKLIEFGFLICPELEVILKDEMKRTEIDFSDESALDGLYPFQKDGVAFIEKKQGRALIGDEMGLGKTIQAIGYLKLHPELRPAVIVCPASLKLNWEKEILQWMPFSSDTIAIVSGREKRVISEDIIIVNYDILSESTMVVKVGKDGKPIINEKTGKAQKTKKVFCRDDIKRMEPKIAIIDESHYTKNSKADRTQAVMDLAKTADKVIALTGTPIINRPIEFFNILNILDGRRWSSFWKYAQTYCGAKHNGFGWDFSGASNTDKLYKEVQSTMIRRLKSEVLPDLPAKVRSVIPLEIGNRSEYDEMVKGIQDMLDSDDENIPAALQLTRFETLKQLVVEGKLIACFNWISDFLESGEKLVVFTTHTNTIDTLYENFSGSNPVKLDGRTSQADRQAVVDRFQNDPNCKLFIGNIKAAGVGITLTSASATCFVELGWTPGEHDQAEDRVHRIGQEADSVNAYYLLANDTIEMEIAELLDEKRKVLESVLDGKEVEDVSLLTQLMAKMTGKPFNKEEGDIEYYVGDEHYDRQR